jgi:hypothetical protein
VAVIFEYFIFLDSRLRGNDKGMITLPQSPPQWREDKKKILDSPVKPGNDRMFLFPPFIKEG